MTANDSISSRGQDAKWNGQKLIALGALTLAIGLTIIYVLASTISRSDLRSQIDTSALHRT